jgi:hypothetical protein
VTEGVAHNATERVVGPVADEDSLAVADVALLAGKVELRGVVLESQGPLVDIGRTRNQSVSWLFAA